jgi:hypothetical protein
VSLPFFFTIFTEFYNKPPKFINPLPTLNVYLNNSLSWPLPWISDPDNDQIASVVVQTLNFNWIRYDLPLNQIVFDNTKLTEKELGLYHFTIKIVD